LLDAPVKPGHDKKFDMRRSKSTTTNTKRTRGRIALSDVDPPASRYICATGLRPTWAHTMCRAAARVTERPWISPGMSARRGR